MKVGRLLFYCILLMLYSCKSGESEKVLTLDDIGGSTDKYKQVDSVVQLVEQKHEKPKESFFLTLFDSIYPDAKWIQLDSMLFPDRFGPKRMEKWVLQTSGDSLVALSYQFKDSLLTRNAFFNWLDCYGPHCESYQIGSVFKKQARHSLFLVRPQQLIYMEGSKALPAEKLIAILDEKKSKQNWSYVVEIPGRAKTKWYIVKEGEIKPIEKNESSQ